MQHWTVEYGTLWALETADGLPPVHQVQPGAEFTVVDIKNIDGLAIAMNLPNSNVIHQRLQGKRRCFSLQIAGEIVTYGWVSLGAEYVGELERQFHLNDEEAYVWDCGTIPAWRGNGLYTLLLGHIIYQLHSEGVPLIWIGASRKNRPSVQGIASAGFRQVVDLTYRRFLRLSLMWLHQSPRSGHPLVPEAYRILVNHHERLAIGYCDR
jgi:GNAT superfamily N-acetyltransferase